MQNETERNSKQPDGFFSRVRGFLSVKYGDVNVGTELRVAAGITGRVTYKIFAVLLDVIITLLLVIAVTGIIVVTAFAVYINNNIDPTFDDSLIITSTDKTSQLYYMDYTDRTNRIGEAVAVNDQVLIGSEYSIWANYNELPKNLINAFIAIEDERFFSHGGVDWFRTIAAAANQVLHIKETFGGSTITQQLVKNATQDDDFTIQRKVQEILRAINLESTHSKEEIITMYLNIINLSQNCRGVQSAAHTYFSKDVSELTLIECAAIAAIPKSPYKYDPIRHPEYNTERRRNVLDKMLELGAITRAEYDEVYYDELELNIQRTSAVASKTSWYVDAMINDIIEDYSEKYEVSTEVASLKLYTAGWNIFSVYDPELQKTLEDVYLDDAYFPEDETGIQPQSSAVIIDPATGDLLALVGGRGEKTLNRGLNRATQSKRPCGSSIKPLSVYAPALESGLITWGSVFDDIPVNFGVYDDIEDAKAWPVNSTGTYEGLTTVYDALRKSTNTIAVRTLQLLGIDTSFEFLTKKCHIDNLIESYTNAAGVTFTDKAIAPLALGQFSFGVTVREMTAAYQIFANKGIYNYTRTYIKVTDADGNVILSNDKPSEVVITEQTADIMTKLMEAVVDSGTARKITLKNSIDIAGKTGTTNADFDRWFIGYTPYYLCGVWFGYDYNQTLSGFSVNPAMTIWDSVMTLVHEDLIAADEAGTSKLKKFTDASGVVQCTYCKDSGKLVTDACAHDPRGDRTQTGYFTTATVPTEECDTHILVNFDKTTGGVASSYCERDDIVQYALVINEDRSFPVQVKVTDAQYVYRKLPSNVRPCGWYGDAFFANTLADGEYCGTSGTDTPFNRFCYIHYDFHQSTGIDTSHFAGDEPDPPDTVTTETEPPDTQNPSTDITDPPETEPQETDIIIPDPPDIDPPDEYDIPID